MVTFRVMLRLEGIHLQGNPDGQIAFTLASPRHTDVLIENPRKYGDERHGDAIATAMTTVSPSPQILAAFKALDQLRLPDGVPQASLPNWRRFQDPSGSLQADRVLPLSGLPTDMATLIDSVRKDLVTTIRQACHLLRWRHDLEGPHNPLHSYGPGSQWALKEGAWHPLPANTSLRAYPVPFVYPTPAVAEEVHDLLVAGEDEPIAHQVFREAWTHRHSGRRSALVIAVAALEVGTTLFLARISPPTEWLLTNLPTPSAQRLLAKYLPTLATPLQFDGVTKPPPRRVLKLVEKAVVTRNRIAHSTGEDVSHDGLEAMLEAIRDVLWLLDYYSGNAWALRHLSRKTRDELQLPDPDAA